MIEVKDLNLDYGRGVLVEKADVIFPSGATTALIGRNGTGKSTLLRAIAGLNPKYTGEIKIDGTDIKRLRPDKMARLLALVTTERVRIPNMTCLQITAMGRSPFTDWSGRLRSEDKEAAFEALETVGMAEFAARNMNTMSDGECQRIMIARAIAQDTPAILLDEPTSFLDMPNRYKLAHLLNTLAHDKGKCIIYSTHELDIALQTCDNIALIHDHRITLLPSSEMRESGLIEDKLGINL